MQEQVPPRRVTVWPLEKKETEINQKQRKNRISTPDLLLFVVPGKAILLQNSLFNKPWKGKKKQDLLSESKQMNLVVTDIMGGAC